MTSDETPPRDAPLVPGAHRTIRILDEGEGPFSGTLVAQGDSIAVKTDADAISGWAGWAHAGDEHVAGPIDLVRRTDGHDVLLPWCTERVSAFLGRRSAAQEPLSAGEVSTLVGSLLRGVAELGTAVGAERTGDWWVTDGGRPLFVIGQGVDARAAAGRLVERLRGDCVDRALARVLGVVAAGLDDLERPQLPARLLEGWEAELLAIAAPRPLRRDVHGPERVRDIEVVSRKPSLPLVPASGRSGAPRSRAATRSAGRSATGPQVTGIRGDRAAAFVASLLARMPLRASDRLGSVGGRRPRASGDQGEGETAQRTHKRRRGRVVVAGVAVAVVLGVGLLWPQGETVEGAIAQRPVAPAASASTAERGDDPDGGGSPTGPASPQPDAVPSADAAADPDPAVATAALWELVGACVQAGDRSCASALTDGAVGVVDTVGQVADAEPSFSLVDEYGDVAVIQATVSSAGSTGADYSSELMLVLVRAEERWLVRDVYDVADQP